jgi:hypothetical protein
MEDAQRFVLKVKAEILDIYIYSWLNSFGLRNYVNNYYQKFKSNCIYWISASTCTKVLEIE